MLCHSVRVCFWPEPSVHCLFVARRNEATVLSPATPTFLSSGSVPRFPRRWTSFREEAAMVCPFVECPFVPRDLGHEGAQEGPYGCGVAQQIMASRRKAVPFQPALQNQPAVRVVPSQ